MPEYSAPPILEAVVQVSFAEPLALNIHRKLTRKLARNYAVTLDQNAVEAKIDFETRRADFHPQPQARLSSDDQADILIVGLGSLTWSRLSPYTGWAVLAERLHRDMQAAHASMGPRKLSRMGLRYINRLDFPIEDEIGWYEKYIAINLTLPPQWQIIQAYGWRFERLFDDGLRAIVQSGTVEPEVPGTGAVLLDIDIVAEGEIPIKLEEQLLRLELMRKLKNEIFETSVTDLARERFS